MTGIWGIVAALGLGTMAIKAAGPVLLGSRPLPDRVKSVVALALRAPMLAVVLVAALAAALARLAGIR